MPKRPRQRRRRAAQAIALAPEPDQPIPMQPVDKPILSSPYQEPQEYWVYHPETGVASKAPGRRPAGYWYKNQRSREQQQGRLLAEENFEDLPHVNALREDVANWRESKYRGATDITRKLLKHWRREDRANTSRRLFFCQLEAVETVIYLAEMRIGRQGRRRTGPRPQFSDADLARLTDAPLDPSLPALTRLGCKMATGSGKTVVMAMLIAWAFCNRAARPGDDRFPAAALIVCPNLTIRTRLQVLRPDIPDNYYKEFDIVPSDMMPHLAKGKTLITNWHQFAPESEHAEGGRTFTVVNKGEESATAFARRALGDLADRGPIMVLNDEGHHAYRPAPLAPDSPASAEDKAMTADEKKTAKDQNEEATVWVQGLDRINAAVGVRLCVDLSATPFYIKGSGHPEGEPFPWLVSDFSLVDAIESGIVKIPRLPVSDTTGRPEPKYFRLWKNIIDQLPAGDFLPGKARRPKPEAVLQRAEDALLTLASQYKKEYDKHKRDASEKRARDGSQGQPEAPPAMIIVCDSTDLAEVFYRHISGEREVPDDDGDNGDDSADGGGNGANDGADSGNGGNDDDSADGAAADSRAKAKPARGKSKSKAKAKTRTAYGGGALFPDSPEIFSNAEGKLSTLRIDTKALAAAESGKGGGGEDLRKIVDTVGKPGKPGANVQCVVSVQMLSEGWDANNVTHILGLRAFESQLLCEQVVGRGLRRRNYAPDPKTGLLNEEYVDVYGIPFSVIPYKGRPTKATPPDPRPLHHIHALEERRRMEIEFPVVEGYAFDLKRNQIKADISQTERLSVEPNIDPTAVFIKPQVGYETGAPTLSGPGDFAEQNRKEFYASTHIQRVKFEITRRIVDGLLSGSGDDNGGNGNNGGGGSEKRPKRPQRPPIVASRHQIFPQAYSIVDEYIARKVDFNGADERELGLQTYMERVTALLLDAIQPNDERGEPPLLPILNRYKPRGSTADVDFKTVQAVHPAAKSHLNQVALDTRTWESAAAFQLEMSPLVECYAKNDRLGLTIAYEYGGASHFYEPDFVVRLANKTTLVLEVKGYEPNQAAAKHEAAKRWTAAVNNWGAMGKWAFHVCRNPQTLQAELAQFA